MKKILVALAVVLVAQIIVGGPVAVAAPPAWGPIYHTVQWGESLSSIAARYGVSPWAIAQANGIWNPNYIRAGQVLIIPGYSPWPSPKPGPCPWPGACPAQPWPHCVYIVRYGDTLSSIAWRYGTTVWALTQANGLWNPNYVYRGQRLVIPYCN